MIGLEGLLHVVLPFTEVLVDCDWSVVIDYGDDKEFPVETTEDIPVLTRKRCNTMPGCFIVPNDVAEGDCHVHEGEL